MDTDRKFNPATGAAAELQIRIVCAGRSVDWVLEEIHKGLRQALVEHRDPLIILEDLVLLKDSVSNLLKGVCRELVGYPRTVSFWESSGITEAFMSAMEAPTDPGKPPPLAS
jgi:hypothetical protein